jgi:hypothetical protein
LVQCSDWLRLGFKPGQPVTNIISPIVVNEVSINPFFVKYFQHFQDKRIFPQFERISRPIVADLLGHVHDHVEERDVSCTHQQKLFVDVIEIGDENLGLHKLENENVAL